MAWQSLKILMGTPACVNGISFMANSAYADQNNKSMVNGNRLSCKDSWESQEIASCFKRHVNSPTKLIRRIKLDRHFQTNVEALGSGTKVQVRLKTC